MARPRHVPPPTGPSELETKTPLDGGAADDTLSSYDNMQLYNNM